jgi:hypothetical protein
MLCFLGAVRKYLALLNGYVVFSRRCAEVSGRQPSPPPGVGCDAAPVLLPRHTAGGSSYPDIQPVSLVNCLSTFVCWLAILVR